MLIMDLLDRGVSLDAIPTVFEVIIHFCGVKIKNKSSPAGVDLIRNRQQPLAQENHVDASDIYVFVSNMRFMFSPLRTSVRYVIKIIK